MAAMGTAAAPQRAEAWQPLKGVAPLLWILVAAVCSFWSHRGDVIVKHTKASARPACEEAAEVHRFAGGQRCLLQLGGINRLTSAWDDDVSIDSEEVATDNMEGEGADAWISGSGGGRGGQIRPLVDEDISKEIVRGEPEPGAFDKAPPVELALYLNNLDQVGTRSSTWHGDVIMQSRYRKADFPNKTIRVELLDGKVDYRNEVRHWEEGGFVTKMEHLYMSIHYQGDYDQFPFDTQDLVVAVQVTGLSAREAKLVEWKNHSGVRPKDNITGRNFHTQQFYLSKWFFRSLAFKEHGVPYWKARAELHVVIARFESAYFLTCIFIPSLAICFALGAFFLPLTLIVPRVTMSFTSFLAIFVHMKQMSALVPDGVWCWLLTDMVFFCAVLCALVSANIASARMQKDHPKISDKMDRMARTLLPVEFVCGQILLWAGRYYHRQLGVLVVAALAGTAAYAVSHLFHEEEKEEIEKHNHELAVASQKVARLAKDSADHPDAAVTALPVLIESGTASASATSPTTSQGASRGVTSRGSLSQQQLPSRGKHTDQDEERQQARLDQEEGGHESAAGTAVASGGGHGGGGSPDDSGSAPAGGAVGGSPSDNSGPGENEEQPGGSDDEAAEAGEAEDGGDMS